MAPATLDPTRVLSPGPSPAAAFALPLPLENVGGVSVLRPSPRVPIVVGGRTLGSFGGGDGIAGVGGGISLRIGEDGRSGIFGSVFGAPVVGDFSIGTLFRLGGR
ncbi:MAG: hypothetical protein IT381_11115 [Deltaproteobacteria bacterium]|nr:hypothetical protein [Deltaproteobacteria bacterium]